MADTPADVVLTITARDGQYHIHSSSGVDDPWPGTDNGLFVGEDTWVAVLCGTQWGPVKLNLHRRDSRPAEVDTGWDMVAEWTLNCPTGQLTVQSPYSSEAVTTLEVPAGWIRLRASVRNRLTEAEATEPIAEPTEQHQLQYWPVPDRKERSVLHGPDDFGSMYLGATS